MDTTLSLHIEARLASWAEWRLKRDDSGVGFPSAVAFARMQEVDMAVPAGPWSPNVNEAAAEIDQCVVALEDDRFEAIMHFYTRSSSIEQKFTACGCCKKTFYNRLDYAKKDILGYLNDLAAGIRLPLRERAKKIA